MARKRGSRAGNSGREIAERAEWIFEKLSEYGDGIHRLGEPALLLDSELPEAVECICRVFNGAELFHESIVLFPGAEVRHEEEGFLVGECNGDDVFVRANGTVWRFDSDIEDVVPEGSRFDRWLAGAVDAESVLYDKEGEFLDDVFDEEGELSDAADAERARRQLKRDPKAVGPRWRLARALVSAGDSAAARGILEDVVSDDPLFAWAWFDLARISEGLGQPETASEEAQHAGELRSGNPFFLAHAARLAQVAGLDERAQLLAQEVLRLDPDLPRNHVEAARAYMKSGDRDGALELLVLAKVIAPRDLQVIDLLSQLQN